MNVVLLISNFSFDGKMLKAKTETTCREKKLYLRHEFNLFGKLTFKSNLCGIQIHSNLDLGAVNLSVYLDLVAICLITDILLIKNSKLKRFRPILPIFQTLDLGVVFFINF